MSKKLLNILRNYSLPELFLILFERKLRVRLPISSKLRWKFNISSEIRFWDRCIRTNGLIWPEEYKLRFDPILPLQDLVVKLLPQKRKINILDVGAGPFTYLGKVYDGVDLNIVAVDPLADIYDKLLTKYSITPIVRTAKLDAEKLTTKYSEDSFDLIFARNCIDHSYSPETAILEMLKVVKKNRYIFMMHRPNEAEKENWRGLHQWNFSNENGDFIIASRHSKINFSQKYVHLCETKCSYDSSDDMLLSVILKR